MNLLSSEEIKANKIGISAFEIGFNKLEKVFEPYALVGILSVSKLYQNDRIFGLTRAEILKKFGVFVRFVD